jgi:hypothetical protein
MSRRDETVKKQRLMLFSTTQSMIADLSLCLSKLTKMLPVLGLLDTTTATGELLFHLFGAPGPVRASIDPRACRPTYARRSAGGVGEAGKRLYAFQKLKLYNLNLPRIDFIANLLYLWSVEL